MNDNTRMIPHTSTGDRNGKTHNTDTSTTAVVAAIIFFGLGRKCGIRRASPIELAAARLTNLALPFVSQLKGTVKTSSSEYLDAMRTAMVISTAVYAAAQQVFLQLESFLPSRLPMTAIEMTPAVSSHPSMCILPYGIR